MRAYACHRLSLFALAGLLGCGHGTGAREKGGLSPVPGLALAAVEAAARPRRVALLVGIDHVDDPMWPALRFAAKDARDLATVLRDPAVGAFDEVVVLGRADETGRDQLLAAVRALAGPAPRADDTVVVFFSGHGSLAQTPRGDLERVIIARDTRKEALLATGLRLADLLEAFEALPSRRKALVLATCHSGGGKGLVTPDVSRLLQGQKGTLAPLETVSHAALVLSASDLGQPAREDDRLENDVYTHYLVEALARGADANGDGAVTATEAHDWARRRTYEFTGGRQVPTLEAAVVGADPVVLAGRVERPGLPVLYSYADGLQGYEVRQDGRPKGTLPGNVVLDAGDRAVSVVGPDGVAVFDGQVSLGAGERTAVESLLDRARPRFAATVQGGALVLLGAKSGGTDTAPLGATGLALRMRDAPWPGLDPSVDFLVAGGDQLARPGLMSVPQRVRVTGLGVGASYARDLGALRLWAGPRLTFEVLTRHLALDGLAEDQTFATVLPGLALGGASALGRLELGVELRLHYLPLVVDGVVHSIAAATVAAGVGLRF